MKTRRGSNGVEVQTNLKVSRNCVGSNLIQSQVIILGGRQSWRAALGCKPNSCGMSGFKSHPANYKHKQQKLLASLKNLMLIEFLKLSFKDIAGLG